MAYTALARANVTIELFENEDKYEAVVVSTNGVILQPYDTSTTLIGTVLKNNIDITKNIKNIKWTKWNPTSDNLLECEDWNKLHTGSSTITVSKEDVDSKSIFTFEAYDNRDDLLCSASISIIDINDLLASTAKPNNPYVGQLWIDDTTDPATLYVWNGYKWVVSGAVGAMVKNLLKNTGFLFNCDKWDIVGDTRLMYTPTPHDYLDHRFLKLNSDELVDSVRGISQITTDYIVPKSNYSFQMLYYSKEDSQSYSNDINIEIYSVDSSNNKIQVYSNTITAEEKLKKLYARFKSLDNTKYFMVKITGENKHRFDFNIAEPCLYNTHNEYPWTTHPSDDGINLTQENLWNILSNNNTVKGITSIKNPITGQLDYYINADAINAGQIKAQYMNMYGLTVTRKDDPSIKTFEITEDGKVNMTVEELRIGSSNKTLEDYINTEITVDGDSIKTALRNEFNTQFTEINTTIGGVSTRVENLEDDTKTLFDITDKGVYIEVGSDGSSTLVDVNNNSFNISTENIKLEGYTTINGGFSVDLDGNMTANNGTFSGTIIASTIKSDDTDNPQFSLTSDGILRANNVYVKGEISGTIPDLDKLISESGNFIVNENGILEANEAIIHGNITAGSTITGSTIRNSSRTFEIDREGNIRGGSININDKFKVDRLGNMEATSANIVGNINAGSVINGATIYIPGKDDGYAEFIYDITLENGYMKMANRLTPNDRYLLMRSNELNNSSITEMNSFDETYMYSIYGSLSLTDRRLSFTEKRFDKYYGDPYDKYDTYTYTMWNTDHFEINDGFVRGKDLICINDIKHQSDANYEDPDNGDVIYKGESNTFIADHFDKGYNTIGDFSGSGINKGHGVITLGDCVIIYGSTTFENLSPDTSYNKDINFEDIKEYVLSSAPLSDAPFITTTVSSYTPSAFSCSVSDVTKTGFTLYCNSLYGSPATIYWMAIGPCQTNVFAYKIYENFTSFSTFTMVDGAYDPDTPRVFY